MGCFGFGKRPQEPARLSTPGLVLTNREQAHLYRLVDQRAERIDEACKGNGRMTRTLRRKAADVLVKAFNAEIQNGNPRPSEDQCKERASTMRSEENCGFIEWLLVMIAINVISRLIVTWLIDIWNSRGEQQDAAEKQGAD